MLARPASYARLNCLVSGLVASLVWCVVVDVNSNLSAGEMDAVRGFRNCKKCPDTAGSSCGQVSCSYFPSIEQCPEDGGGTYKTCAQAENPEMSCVNTTRVSCGTRQHCILGEGGCNSETYNCSCHQKQLYFDGCP